MNVVKTMLLPIMVSVGVTTFLLMYLGPVAQKLQLIDRPVGRKTHKTLVPLIGGIAIVVGVFFALPFLPFGLSRFRIFVFCLGMLLFLGVVDDYCDLSAIGRILFQAIIISILVVGDGLIVHSIGDIFAWNDGNAQGLGLLAIPLTVLAVVGAINAFNMIDGHDGLAISIFLISLATIISLNSGPGADKNLNYLLFLFLAPGVIFFLFNLSLVSGLSRKSFLGDAGSNCIGLILVYALITLSQKESGGVIRTSSAPWIISLPLLDFFAVILFRVRSRQSPMRADRRHIHHLLAATGLSARKILFVLIGIHGALCTVILILEKNNATKDWLLFWGVFPIFALYLFGTTRIRAEQSS